MRTVLLGLLVLGAPALASGQSLWREGAPGASLFADHRARGVNDLVTVLVVEQSSSSRSAQTTTSKDTSRTAGVTKFPTLFDPAARQIRELTDAVTGHKVPSELAQDALTLELSGKASHQGKGEIDRTDKVSGQVAARVVKVLDNGTLVIEGRRAILVNNETQVITISGIVRPQDITGANTVLSSQIADAEIRMVGRGVLADTQRPGFLFRFLDWLRIF